MCSGKPRNGERGPAHAPTSLPAKPTVSAILLAYAVRPTTEQLSTLFLSSSTSTRLLADCYSHRLAELCALGSREMASEGLLTRQHPFLLKRLCPLYCLHTRSDRPRSNLALFFSAHPHQPGFSQTVNRIVWQSYVLWAASKWLARARPPPNIPSCYNDCVSYTACIRGQTYHGAA